MKSSKLILVLQGRPSGPRETEGDRWALLGTFVLILHHVMRGLAVL